LPDADAVAAAGGGAAAVRGEGEAGRGEGAVAEVAVQLLAGGDIPHAQGVADRQGDELATPRKCGWPPPGAQQTRPERTPLLPRCRLPEVDDTITVRGYQRLAVRGERDEAAMLATVAQAHGPQPQPSARRQCVAEAVGARLAFRLALRAVGGRCR